MRVEFCHTIFHYAAPAVPTGLTTVASLYFIIVKEYIGTIVPLRHYTFGHFACEDCCIAFAPLAANYCEDVHDTASRFYIDPMI